MNLFQRLQKTRRFCLLACLLFLAGVLCVVPAAGQSASNETDDGSFTVYTYISANGSISASASDPTPDGYEDYAYYELQGEPTWYLSGSNYSDSGEGDSFSSGPVPGGGTYSANFYFSVVSYYYEYAPPEAPSTCDVDGDLDFCATSDYPYGYASVDVPSPPPIIDQLSPSSANQGDQGTLTITGRYLVQDSSDQLSLTFTGPNNSNPSNPFTLVSQPSTCNPTCSATYSYDLTYTAPGQYNIFLANNESSSDGAHFTVNQGTLPVLPSALPPDSCDVSNPQVGFTSIVPTGTPGGSATMTVSFSGAAFSMVNLSVSYGPSSTPSSIAASIAALVTRNYYQYGMSARAFGPNVIYSGNAVLGTVSDSATGSSFGTNSSPAAGVAAGNACESAQPLPPAPPTDVVIVGWIDKNAVMLPQGESTNVDSEFPRTGVNGPSDDHFLACGVQVGLLAVGKVGLVLQSANDKAYASAWLLKYSGNDDPGNNIALSNIQGHPESFRIFNEYSSGGTTHNTAVGDTLDPCGSGIGVLGVQDPNNGTIGRSRFGYKYQLAEVRVDKAGQNGFRALNGHDIPWVWSVIEFDQNGEPVQTQNALPNIPTTNYQIFPTYSVYQDGKRQYVVHQGTAAAFASLPSGMELFPGEIE